MTNTGIKYAVTTDVPTGYYPPACVHCNLESSMNKGDCPNVLNFDCITITMFLPHHHVHQLPTTTTSKTVLSCCTSCLYSAFSLLQSGS
mmetsp:Transcript_35560/g.42829  ORF Transcript_35560/g.42829 Transcript_35560/m.42829 type:complete len:89 (-) Transcript_35560:135-401(-)